MSFTVSANTPLRGYISWSNVHIVYDGVDYAIQDGETNKRFASWKKATPDALVFSDVHPVLTEDDCIVFLNKGGVPISVLTASSTDGDLVVPGTITSSAIATGAIVADHIKSDAITARHILAGSIVAEKMAVNELSAISANLGTIAAGNFTLDADGFIKGGAANYSSGNGFWMGYHQGAYKFRAGAPGSSMMEWNGEAFNIYGPDGGLTISSGVVDYTKIPNQPTSLADINGSEGRKLDGVEDGATRNVFRGDWVAGKTYVVGDVVIDSTGNGWSALKPHVADSTNAPPGYPQFNYNNYWTIYAIKGEDAVVGLLTNGNATIPATADGTVSPDGFSNAAGTFELYRGVVRIAPTDIIFSIAESVGCVGTINAQGDYAVTAMAADDGYLLFHATVGGTVYKQKLTLSKSKAGFSGESAQSYWVNCYPKVISRDAAGNYATPQVEISAVTQIGTDNPTQYAGRFIIETTIDGVNFNIDYLSLEDESSIAFTLPNGIKSVRVRLYEDGLTDITEFVTILDEASVAIVEDGVEYVVKIESSNGNVFKRGEARRTVLSARVFRNGVEVTNEIPPSGFKWYRKSLDPQPAPYDDNTWNYNHSGGFKSVEVSVDDVLARATFTCDITY